jgi:chromosome segregation ATPase
MLLHNQTGNRLLWEALGKTFAWDPYGPCDIPDDLVEHIKLEGFPVAATPVSPKEKAQRAVESQHDGEKDAEIKRLRSSLEDAEARVTEAERAVQSAATRQAEAMQSELAATSAAELLRQKLATAKDEITEYEAMLSKAAEELDESRSRAKVLEQQAQQAQTRKAGK